MNKKPYILLPLVFLFIFSIPLISQKNPSQYFNKKIGSDNTLIPYPEIIKYFKYIAHESPRIKISNEGNSTDGNPLYLAFISSEENIKNLSNLIEINKKLANPDKVNKEQALKLVDKGKVFVIITCGIHASEIGSSQLSMQIAHQLATSQDPKDKFILNNVVLLLMPSINPDGNIMVTDWFYKNLNTKYEGSMMPFLYHKYAGHDTNRDYYMLNLKESRILNAVLHKKYFPQVFLDMHQMGSTGARMFVPPFKDPYNLSLDPLLLKETELIGTSMALKLQQHNKKGVASGYAFDTYWPGGTKNTAWFKNVVGILTELASVAVASPIYIEENELRIGSKGLPEYKAQVNFPTPWRGGWWRLKDIVEYEQIAVDALLETSAKFKDTFMVNFYTSGLKAVQKGKSTAPYGYHIPVKQWDPSATIRFLKKFQEGGVKIYKLSKDTMFNNQLLKKSDYIIPLAQSNGNFVRIMMEKQKYPEIRHMVNGPIMEPYDVCGWTLPFLMGVKHKALNQAISELELELVLKIKSLEKIKKGEGNCYTFSGRLNNSYKVSNRLINKKYKVYRLKNKTQNLMPGDFVIKKDQVSEDTLLEMIKGTSVSVRSVDVKKTALLKSLKFLRIGIFQPYVPSMDEGWTRWVLDDFEFPYTILHNQDLKKTDFSKKYDVLIMADISRDIIIEGKSKGWYSKYLKTMPPEFQGGIGKKGVEQIKLFLKKGKTLILFDSAFELAEKDLSLPIRNALAKISRDKFYCPGSILKIKVDNTDPVAWGLKEESILFFSRSAAFKTSPPMFKHIQRKVIGLYPDTDDHLISGYLKGEKLLNRTVSTVRFKYYDGNVIVLGGRVQNRGQTFATFKFLFNSIFL